MKAWFKNLPSSPWIALFGLIGTAIAIFTFVTGISSLRAALSLSADPTVTASLPVIVLMQTTLPATPPPVEHTPIILPSPTWSDPLSLRMPTLNEIRQNMLSIWDANHLSLGDMLSPEIRSFKGTAAAKREYLWPIYWCAINATTLSQDMESIATTFSVNGETVPEKYIFNYNYDTNTNWKCNYHATVLSNWQRNAKYTLQVTRIFQQEVFDGQSSYPAGVYAYELSITVP